MEDGHHPRAECAAASEQSFLFAHAMMSPCSAQPGPAPLGEMCYAEPPDANMDGEEMALINQLMELPAFMDLFSDPAVVPPMPDAGQAPFANMDTNPNQNFGLYPQDFSHYADLQFNMLVNGNWDMQTESPASPSNVVQVKIEDDL